MSIWHLIVEEIRMRRLSFALGVLSVLVAVGVHFWGMFAGGMLGTDEVSEINDSYYTFLAEEYVTLYDIIAFGENLEVEADYEIDADFLLESGFIHVTLDDIIEHFDSDEVSEYFQMASF